MNPEAHALIGAYSLDALPDDDRRDFEEHLAVCGFCREEVSQFQSVAALLAVVVEETPPVVVREQVLRRIDLLRQVPPSASPGPGLKRSVALRGPRLAPMFATAAAFVLAVTLGVTLGGRADPGQQQRAELLSSPDARTVLLSGAGTGNINYLYSPSVGRGLLAAAGLQAPDGDEVYQLWLIRGGTPASAGTFSPGAGGEGLELLVDADAAGAEAIALTVEPQGGSPAPTGAVIASAVLT